MPIKYESRNWKKSGNGANLDKIMTRTPEQRVVPDDMITQKESYRRRIAAIRKSIGAFEKTKRELWRYGFLCGRF